MQKINFSILHYSCAIFILLVTNGAADPAHSDSNKTFNGHDLSPSTTNTAYLEQCGEDNKKSSSINQQDTPERQEGLALYKEAMSILGKAEHKCATCHREGSQDGTKLFTDILSVSELLNKGIINPEKPELSKLHLAVKNDSMPLDGTALNTQEKAKILEWIKAGAPNDKGVKAGELAVGFVSEADKMLCILKDLNTIPKEYQKHIRYFSLTHLYNAGKSTEDVQVALNRLMNSLSWNKKLVLPKKVDGLGTLLRIDLRDFGWNSKTWELVQKKNPYGIEFSSKAAKDVYEKTQAEFPDVRGDWFVFSASKPPLYHDVLGLPGEDGKPGAEKALAKMLGIENNTTHHPEEHFSVGVRQSGVSINNRIYHRSPTVDSKNTDTNDPKRVNGYFYSSDDFSSSDDKQSIFAHPTDYQKNGGEFIGSIPKENERGEKMNAQVYLLANDQGVRLDDVDANLGIVSHPKRVRNSFRVANGVSCFDCHERLGAGIITTANPLADHIKGNFHTFTKNNQSVKLLEQFKTDDQIKPIFSKDQALYQKFMDETGGKPGIVFDVATQFDDDLTENQVASELGLTLKDFREKVEKDPVLSTKMAFNSAGVLSRKTFLKEFKDVVGLLALGGIVIKNNPSAVVNKPVDNTAGGLLIRVTEVEKKLNVNNAQSGLVDRVSELEAKLRLQVNPSAGLIARLQAIEIAAEKQETSPGLVNRLSKIEEKQGINYPTEAGIIPRLQELEKRFGITDTSGPLLGRIDRIERKQSEVEHNRKLIEIKRQQEEYYRQQELLRQQQEIEFKRRQEAYRIQQQQEGSRIGEISRRIDDINAKNNEMKNDLNGLLRKLNLKEVEFKN